MGMPVPFKWGYPEFRTNSLLRITKTAGLRDSRDYLTQALIGVRVFQGRNDPQI